jgi:hypothetical protein
MDVLTAYSRYPSLAGQDRMKRCVFNVPPSGMKMELSRFRNLCLNHVFGSVFKAVGIRIPKRPIAPGNGSGSPPPWDLSLSGGLFLVTRCYCVTACSKSFAADRYTILEQNLFSRKKFFTCTSSQALSSLRTQLFSNNG